MTLPTGIYSSIFQGFVGDRSDADKAALWQRFTQERGLTLAPPVVLDTQAQLVSFLQNYSDMQTKPLSPEDVAKRSVLSSIIDIILQITRDVQTASVLQGKLSLFYQKSQAEYAKMQASVPINIGAQSQKLDIDSDPTKFSFGYNDITLQEVCDYLADIYLNSGDDNDFYISRETDDTHTYFLRFVTTTASPRIEFGLNFDGLGSPQITTNLTEAVEIPSNPTKEEISAAYAQALYDLNDRMDDSVFDDDLYPYIPWLYQREHKEGESSTARANADADVQARAAANQKNQQFIEGIKSKIETLQNDTDATDNLMQSLQTSVRSQISIISSNLRTLESLLTAIFP